MCSCVCVCVSSPFGSTGLWLMYGLLLDDPTMKFVNTIGFALQSFYLLWFHVFTHNRRRLNTENFILLSFLSSVYLYGQYHPLEGVSWVGLLACISSLIFSASPLAAVSDVIRTRSTEKLPFSMILASFLVSMLWYTYGYMINDSYVYIPNSVNTLLSGLQLSLFLVFPSKVHAEVSWV